MSPPGGGEVPLGSPAGQAPVPENPELVVPAARRPVRRSQIRRVLVALLAIALLYTCAIAQSLLLPILVAIFTAVLLNPVVRMLHRLMVPRWLSALGVVGGLLALLVGFGMLVYEPAMEAARDAPRNVRQIAPKLRQMVQPIEEASKVGEALDSIDTTRPNEPQRVQVVQPRPTAPELIGSSAPTVAAVLGGIILVYFFLVFGDSLFRRAVMVAPTLAEKRLTVEIVRSIQTDMSRYMLTITIINLCLGITTAAALWALGLPQPMLWGALAALLNYAPYVGPLATTLVLGVAGLFEFDNIGQAVLPALTYLGLSAVEGQFLTPLLLGNSLALNPVIILLWLMFWGWMWGIPGFLLGVPMLVCFKIICARVESLQPISTMLEK